MQSNPVLDNYQKNLQILLNKENKTYKDRCDIWMYERFFEGKSDEGEEIEIYDGKALANNEIKHLYDNEDFPEWFQELGNHFGQKCRVNNTSLTLKGVSYTYVDFYYILEDSNKKRRYVTCCKKLYFK